MLQRSKPFQSQATEGRESDSIQETLSWVTKVFQRQFYLIVIVVLLSCALGGVYILTTPKRYSSMAEMVIDSRKTQMLQQQNPMGVEAPVDSAMVDSQVEIMRSESIALAVVKDLRLKEKKEFVGGGGLMSAILDIFSFDDGDAPSDFMLTRAALYRFQSMLTIKRRLLSYVIEITYQSEDPALAAQIANAVAEAYIVDSLESKYQASRRAATWLQDRLSELRAQASAADRAVVDFKAKNNIVDAGGRLLNEQQLSEVNSSLTIARATTAEAQARFDRINDILRNSKEDALVNDIATVTDTLRNDVINRLRTQYLDLAARESNWSQKYGAQHLAVINLQNQMKEIRRSISDELRRIAESYKSDLEIAKSRQQSVEASLGTTISQTNQTNQAQIILRDLESNAQSSRALADNFLQLYMVSVQQQSFPMTEARVITQASPALGKSAPKTSMVALICLFGGTIVAFGLATIRDLSDRVFRTSEQIESELEVPCIAIVPKVDSAELAGQLRGSGDVSGSGHLTTVSTFLKKLSGNLGSNDRTRRIAASPASQTRTGLPSRVFSSEPGVMDFVIASPFSRAAEAMRSIRMALELGSLDTSSKVIGITSTLPNEGKTTTSSAFAAVMAKSGVRTLLVDGDLRNPSLTRQLAPSANRGLLEVLLGTATLEEVVWSDPSTGLHFLPTAIEARLAHTSDILLSEAMEQLFQKLRGTYDRIVLDLSPIAPIVDVRGTGKLVDSYILVIEWGRTKTDVVQRAISEMPVFQHKLLGAVLNKVDLKRMTRYGRAEGDYHYNRYYKQYGYH
ncbi:polysaccharide biosynthesis tyrosine autokinase [Bradyrhizobium sp. JYMT SZCCT0428]|uniref:polysaccharide biosynthesis tyrosine autokinase n=1 Tax=Bradyrhizobium sp. JYMT SZCCT0428 TaxID=2807673 RepID=UPI001BACA466|nr:polysaccharide biosynthesis tyrosine autokinase [Bradyrhizobium sp. JYMT SZCCT0428]MBR1151595.1 polysaccharide biosynthesis tyrosine autokinase [Bradyrhizobium sp. JYMT SZCCT0428]